MLTGINHRQMGVSNSNEHSSRSHCLLLCEVLSESVSPDDNTMYIHKNGNLTFVDLAGKFHSVHVHYSSVKNKRIKVQISNTNITETIKIFNKMPL